MKRLWLVNKNVAEHVKIRKSKIIEYNMAKIVFRQKLR